MAKLIVVEGPDRGSEFPLPEEPGAYHTVGRDPRNPVALSDASVSREHLRIEFTGRGYRLIDVGSKNRTFLNGEPVRESLLRSGDLIGAGDSELRFEEDRALLDDSGLDESTIIKELPVAGRSGVDGLLEALGAGTGAKAHEERSAKGLKSLRELLGLSQALSKSASMEDLHRELLNILVPAIEADRAIVLGLSGRRWIARAVHLGGQVETGLAAEGTRVSESIVRRVADLGKAILSANTKSDERFHKKASIVEGGITSAVAAPIFTARTAAEARSQAAGRTVTGILYADRRKAEQPFGDGDLELVMAAAEQASAFTGHLGEEARLRDENRTLLRSISHAKRIVGRSKAMAEVNEFIRRSAPVHQTILIRGETGTGKELVAAAIHYQGPRRGKAFVAINCAAIPEPLIESELFGHERGAFTGAVARRKGKFELADGGTVFLDEVAELSAGCQAKLLRLLEERRFERLGGHEPVEVDVRIIAATNNDLSRAIAESRFREDLFYRLNVLGVTLPPLRERIEDLPLLIAHFLEELGEGKRELAPEAQEKLRAYDWPGNVRQLRNVIESAVILTDGPLIRAESLVLPQRLAAGGAPPAWEPLTLEELERRHILKVLEQTGGNKKRAADILGIERCTLYARLRSINAAGDVK